MWSWWRDGSVHAASWPVPGNLAAPLWSLDPVGEVLAKVRRAKTEAKRSQRAVVAELQVQGPATWLPSVEAAEADLVDALSVRAIRFELADDVDMLIALEPEPAD